MRLVSVWGALVLAAGLTCGCVSGPAPRPETYVVLPDDTLYGIAWRFDLNYRDLAAWNGLGASNQLTPGRILLLRPVPGTVTTPTAPPVSAATAAAPSARRPMPRADVPRVDKPKPLPDLPERPDAAGPLPRPGTPPAAAPVTRSPPASGTAPAVVPPTAVSPEGAPPFDPTQPLTWRWPTKATRRPVPVPGGGVLLLGGLGQDVLAAANGRVVYVGSGIRGYGNLVIIKHSDTLLSAYAHNREVSVRENQWVRVGERIGAMGLGPRQVPALYFEIRLNGKPTDVSGYLNRK